jgi:hypothetical protein
METSGYGLLGIHSFMCEKYPLNASDGQRRESRINAQIERERDQTVVQI